MYSVEEFLKKLNLEQYSLNFEVNGISNLQDITDESLKKANVEKLGHRKRILTNLPTNMTERAISDEVEDIDDEEVNDPPPSLPPKGKKILPPVPPTRSSSTKPTTAPRKVTSISKGGSLPHGAKLNQDNYFVMPAVPPVPPREDLGESQTTGIANIEYVDNPPFKIIPTREAPRPPNATKSQVETGILVDLPDDPKPRPIPVPRKRQSVKAPIVAINDEALTKESKDTLNEFDIITMAEVDSKKKSVNFVQNEDDLSDDDDDIEYPDGESRSGLNEKSLTISMRENKDTYQKLISESNLNRTESQGLDKRKSRFFESGKSGYLHKYGGQHGNKLPRKRYVVYDAVEMTLKYFKDKDGEPEQTIPVSRMIDVETEPQAKKPTFHLITPNRRFTFYDNRGNSDEITMWVSILMEAIMNKPNVPCSIGGRMADPDMEGWLSKQGHGMITDFKDRYVVIKGDKLCYYKTFEYFEDDLPIYSLDMHLVSLKEDEPRKRLMLTYHTSKTYVFEAKDSETYEMWKDAIQTSLAKAHGDPTVMDILYENESNKICADCGTSKNVVWAALKFLVITCDRCIGRHRYLGPHVSKARSILMDTTVWTDDVVELFKVVGNAKVNKIWSCKLPPDEAINPDSSNNDRHTFLVEKYVDKKYFKLSEFFGLPEELGEALRKVVVTDDVVETLRLLQSGACVMYNRNDPEDKRTPYELAKDAGKNLQMALLSQYRGDLTLEDWEKEKRDEAAKAEEQHLKLSNFSNNEFEAWEKTGLLMMKVNERENWRDPRMFQLKGRALKYKSSRSEELEVIDLTTLEEIKVIDEYSFSLATPNRTYYLKAFTPEDCTSWYQVIRNKQVFGVALEKQELGPDRIPHVLDKCIKYIEENALADNKTMTQVGVYRKSGSVKQMKDLVILFNQDPARVRLDVEEYSDVHVIACLLKQYLRDLPEPLLTNHLKEYFIANTNDSIEHNERLHRYRDLIKGLPEVNHLCLRALILHLHLVTQLEEYNHMGMKNMMMLFGPIICSCGNTVDQSRIQWEFKVFKDLLTFYAWLFDVTENELKNQTGVLHAIRSFNPINSPNGEKELMTTIQITIFVQNVEDQMKVDSSTKPKDVCQHFVEKHSLNRDTKWALFEVLNIGNFERPVYSKESVYELAISLSNNGKLVVKENLLAEKLAVHQSASLNSIGYLNYSSKGTSWKKNCFVEVKNGSIRIAKSKDATKDDDKFGIHEAKVLLYIGIDPKKKPPGKFGFMLKQQETNQKDIWMKHFSSDNEYDVNMFIAAILSIRYPAGIWCDSSSGDSSEIEASTNNNENVRASQHWGRQV